MLLLLIGILLGAVLIAMVAFAGSRVAVSLLAGCLLLGLAGYLIIAWPAGRMADQAGPSR